MASYPVIGQAKKLKVTVLEIPTKSGKTAKTLGNTRKINVFHLHFHSPHATITHRVNDKSHTKGCTTTGAGFLCVAFFVIATRKREG